MTDPKEFFEKLMADPETKPFMEGLKAKAESYGEDKDKFLNFIFGSMTRWYDSMEHMIANIEGIKLMLLLNTIGEGVSLAQDTIRKSDKSEAARPV